MEKNTALNILMNTCSKSEKCSFDVLKKLYDWGFSLDESNEILKNLIDNNYVNDSRYAKAFANDKYKFNHWGKIKISFTLKQKNISSSVISEALSLINNEKYFNIIEQEISKKLKTIKTENDYEIKAKLYRFSQSRGFEGNIANEIINKLIVNDN